MIASIFITRSIFFVIDLIAVTWCIYKMRENHRNNKLLFVLFWLVLTIVASIIIGIQLLILVLPDKFFR